MEATNLKRKKPNKWREQRENLTKEKMSLERKVEETKNSIAFAESKIKQLEFEQRKIIKTLEKLNEIEKEIKYLPDLDVLTIQLRYYAASDDRLPLEKRKVLELIAQIMKNSNDQDFLSNVAKQEKTGNLIKAIEKIEISKEEIQQNLFGLEKKKENSLRHIQKIDTEIFLKTTSIKSNKSRLLRLETILKRIETRLEGMQPINKHSPFFQVLKDFQNK